jgi:hypothetical protein
MRRFHKKTKPEILTGRPHPLCQKSLEYTKYSRASLPCGWGRSADFRRMKLNLNALFSYLTAAKSACFQGFQLYHIVGMWRICEIGGIFLLPEHEGRRSKNHAASAGLSR